MDLSSDLAAINAALRAEGIRLRLEQRGHRLNLRGPLPCRTTPGHIKVQRLSLGVSATTTGLQEARQLLHLVDLQLRREQFNWQHWSSGALKDQHQRPGPANTTTDGPSATNGPSATVSDPLHDALDAFERAFFNDPQRRRSPAGSRTTWTSAYRPYLRRLDAIANEHQLPLSSALLSRTLSSYSDGSRSRQQCATTLAALARHCNLTLPDNWRAEAAGYGLHRARFRQLPTDGEILEAVLLIPNPRWRLVYGLMATYGLRNHEVFFADLSALSSGGDQVLRVLPTTKTGEHQVWPFHPDWVQRFQLQDLGRNPTLLPAVCTDLRRTTLQQVGRRVAEQFRRYSLPLTPYDLRHAWAVRTIHIGLPDTVAARMMGHSVAVHTRTYHHWITRRDQQQAVDAALSRHLA
ncbi:MAG: site-specific integrase [Synechococcus sp.]